MEPATPDPVIEPATYQCAGCNGTFPPDAGFDDRGEFICRTCHAARSAAVAAKRRGPVPAYAGILRGVTVLRWYAGMLTAFGILTIVIAFCISLLVFKGSKNRLDDARIIGAPLVIGIVMGSGFFIWARLIRMVAELAVAHRDIARNSFKP
jgi:hypothetical protein